VTSDHARHLNRSACIFAPPEGGIKMTDTGQEVVLLIAGKELIDSMANFEMLDILGSDTDSQIIFRTATHQKFFQHYSRGFPV
jgi:hypothetical protein